MKKTYLLVLAAILSMGLASCGGGQGGTSDQSASVSQEITDEDYETAINKVKDMPIANVNGQTALTPGFTTKLSGDNNDRVVLTTKQSVNIRGKGTVDVALAWDYDKKQEHASAISGIKDVKNADGSIDEFHKNLYFNYPTDADIDGITFFATLTAGTKTGTANFVVKLEKANIVFEKLTLEQFYTPAANGLFKWNKDDGSIGVNKNAEGADQRYYYVELPCKVIYITPDNNFAIGADGARFVYLYKVDGLGLEVGKYYAIGGEIANYYGNIQLSYISYAEELKNHSTIAEPVLDNVVDIAGIKEFSMVSDKHMYSVELRNVHLKEATTINLTKRGTFVLVDGAGNEITVAYDYHTGSKGGKATEDGTAWKAIVDGLKTTDSIAIKGNLIYADSESNAKFKANGHSWNLMPQISADAISVDK